MNRDLRRDPSCGLCTSIDTAEFLWSNDLWLVRPIDPPLGVAGRPTGLVSATGAILSAALRTLQSYSMWMN